MMTLICWQVCTYVCMCVGSVRTYGLLCIYACTYAMTPGKIIIGYYRYIRTYVVKITYICMCLYSIVHSNYNKLMFYYLKTRAV